MNLEMNDLVPRLFEYKIFLPRFEVKSILIFLNTRRIGTYVINIPIYVIWNKYYFYKTQFFENNKFIFQHQTILHVLSLKESTYEANCHDIPSNHQLVLFLLGKALQLSTGARNLNYTNGCKGYCTQW